MNAPKTDSPRHRKARRLPGAVCSAVVAGAALVGQAQAGDDAQGGPRTFELDNGLTLLVQEDHRAGVVVSMVWYGVGGSYEYRPLTGISHAVEHMMFKGTEERETGEFQRLITREGGRINAFTAQDYTGYFEQLAADRLELAFELEADRMHQLVFREDEFEREMQVIHEERRQRVDDSPEATAMERFRAVAHLSSQYRDPIIGWQADLDTLELNDLERWYERWYGPANATVVVVGAVDPDDVYELARKHFGPVPEKEIEPPPGGADVDDPGLRRMEIELERARLPLLYMAYNVPSLKTARQPEDAYALQLAAQILDGGRSARLPDQVVRGDGIASVAQASYNSIARLDSLFAMVGRPAGDYGREALEEAFLEQIERLRDEPVSEDELERAITRMLADRVYAEDSLMGRAMRLGRFETTGIGHEEAQLFEERLRSITPDDIREAARMYLKPERLTIGWLQPASNGAAAPEGAPVRGDPAGGGATDPAEGGY